MARIFLLKGDIANPGYVDIPEEATTIREAIYGIGGGIPNGKKFKTVQIGGPSGGLLVEEHLDLPLHFQKLKPYGVRRGDSVITVLDEDRCMVDVACRFMQYTQTEFCGKCVPCREGTKRMNELLWAMRDYRLSESDFHMLTDLGEMISVTAFCNLGRNSYHTLETAIKYFPEEFKDHLRGDCALCELDREPIEPGGLPYTASASRSTRASAADAASARVPATPRPSRASSSRRRDRSGKMRQMLYLHRGLPL